MILTIPPKVIWHSLEPVSFLDSFFVAFDSRHDDRRGWVFTMKPHRFFPALILCALAQGCGPSGFEVSSSVDQTSNAVSGGLTPLPVSTPAPTATPRATATPQPTATPVPTASPQPAPTPVSTPAPLGFIPTPAPAILPKSDDIGLGYNFSSNVTIDSRTTEYVFWGPDQFQGVNISEFQWAQIAGPQAVFIAAPYWFGTHVFGFTKPGIYDFKIEWTLVDGTKKIGYQRVTVRNSASVTMVRENFGRAELSTRNGLLTSTTGIVARGDVITPRVFFDRKTYSAEGVLQGTEEVEVDPDTVMWNMFRRHVDTSCVNGDQTWSSSSGSKIDILKYTSGTNSQNLATLYKFAESGFKPGELVVANYSSKSCRVYLEVTGDLSPNSKGLDGTSLGIAGFRSFGYGVIIE